MIACIDDLDMRRYVIPRGNSSDSSVIDMNRRRPHTLGRNNALTSNHAIHYSDCSKSIPGATIVITFQRTSQNKVPAFKDN